MNFLWLCDQRNAQIVIYKHVESEICLNTGVKEVLPLVSKSRELRKDWASSHSEAIVHTAPTKTGNLHCFQGIIFWIIFASTTVHSVFWEFVEPCWRCATEGPFGSDNDTEQL